MPFVILDYLPNEKLPTQCPIGINTQHISHWEERVVFQGNEHKTITKITLDNGQSYHMPYSFDKLQAILGKCCVIHNFNSISGEYYVEVKKYPLPE